MATKRTPAPTPARQRTPPLPDDAVRVVNGLRRVMRAIELYSQEVYKAYGLTGPQLWALKTLSQRGPLSTGELAAALACESSTLSVLVARLERRGLVRRLRPRADKRFVEVETTANGAALAAATPDAAQGRLLHGLQALAPARLRALRRGVDEIVSMMEAGNVEARFFFSGT
ncbi:MAG: MarR family transcriptional regulator [Gemmatimonadota bacterium]